MKTGEVVIEKVDGRSLVARCFSKYPLKFIIPRKVGPSQIDVVWIYSISYGGGIVSGDSISCNFTIGDGCTSVLTTQTSTKVYKSVGSNCSEQVLEAKIGSNALFACIPDPVTCFSTARYSQKQVFRVVSDSNLVIVDWITSGRYENGEKWDFQLYKSTNCVFSEDNQPIFLDTVLLEQGTSSIVVRMQDYNVIAMIIILGPKLKDIQVRCQEDVKNIMCGRLHGLFGGTNSDHAWAKPSFIASCSSFGPKGREGVVVRVASGTTEAVYGFLRHQLRGMEKFLGVLPYC